MADCAGVLGVDYVTKRIGLALSDAGGKIAFPETTLESRGLESDLEALRSLVEARDVRAIVVGLPLHMDGRRGPEAEAAQRFAQRLAEVTGRPVEMLDERLTTVEAEHSLREIGRRGRKARAVVDAVAATILLRTYLAKRANSSGDPAPA